LIGFSKSSDESIKAYDESIRLNRNNTDALNGKGNALDDEGKYDEALKAYDQAILLNPNFSMAWVQ
jgi:tetratricopeptide (TPR) repeat protein